jgi:hypothetical protein
VTIPGGFIAGDTLGAADMNLLPAGISAGGYAQITADQTSITTVTDVTSLTVTWTAVSSRRYRISFFVGVTHTAITTTGLAQILITDGSGTQKAKTMLDDVETTGEFRHLVGSVCETGLSGSTTRKIRASTDTGRGTMTVTASPTNPSYILVEDVGPA